MTEIRGKKSISYTTFLHHVRCYRSTYTGTRSFLHSIGCQSKISSFFTTLSCQFSSCVRALSRPFSLVHSPLFRPSRWVSFDRDGFISRLSTDLTLIPHLFHPRIVPLFVRALFPWDLCTLLFYRTLQKHFNQNVYIAFLIILYNLYNKKIKTVIFNRAIKYNQECKKRA